MFTLGSDQGEHAISVPTDCQSVESVVGKRSVIDHLGNILASASAAGREGYRWKGSGYCHSVDKIEQIASPHSSPPPRAQDAGAVDSACDLPPRSPTPGCGVISAGLPSGVFVSSAPKINSSLEYIEHMCLLR